MSGSTVTIVLNFDRRLIADAIEGGGSDVA
jgi:hypothetical protein